MHAVLLTMMLLRAEEPREQVIQMLDNGTTPVFAEAFTTAAGGDPSAILASIVADKELHPVLRQAAVSAMSAFPSEAGKRALKAVLTTDISVLRKSAVVALGRDYKNAPDAYSSLVMALSDEEIAVRKAAVRMLAVSPAPAAKHMLEKRAKTESQASVRELIAQVLK